MLKSSAQNILALFFFSCILWQSMDLLKVKGGKTSFKKTCITLYLFLKYVNLSVKCRQMNISSNQFSLMFASNRAEQG